MTKWDDGSFAGDAEKLKAGGRERNEMEPLALFPTRSRYQLGCQPLGTGSSPRNMSCTERSTAAKLVFCVSDTRALSKPNNKKRS